MAMHVVLFALAVCVWIPITGGTWLDGLVVWASTCTLVMLIMVVRMMWMEGAMLMRVYVDDDTTPPDAVVAPGMATTMGVYVDDDRPPPDAMVVLGMTTGMGVSVVIGIPVGDDQVLRAAGLVHEHQGLRLTGLA